MSKCILEAIVDETKSTIETITTIAGYNQTVDPARIFHGNMDPAQCGNYPAVCIMTPGGTFSPERSSSNRLNRTIIIAFAVYVKMSGNAKTEILNLVSDIQKAMMKRFTTNLAFVTNVRTAVGDGPAFVINSHWPGEELNIYYPAKETDYGSAYFSFTINCQHNLDSF